MSAGIGERSADYDPSIEALMEHVYEFAGEADAEHVALGNWVQPEIEPQFTVIRTALRAILDIASRGR